MPLVFIGESPVEKISRLMLLHNISILQVEALPSDLPRNIEVDVSQLVEANQTIHVRDIKVSDGVEVLTDADDVVLQVMESRFEVEAEEVVAEVVEVEEGAPLEGEAETETEQ